MKKLPFKSTSCHRIIGTSVCRLGNDKKDEVEVWGCDSFYHMLCYACLKITKCFLPVVLDYIFPFSHFQ